MSQPPISPGQPKGDRLWLVLCAITSVAVDVSLNKYSSILPGLAVLGLWAVPAILLVIWVWRVERTSGWIRSQFLEHPVSYVLLSLIFIPFAWQATATVVSKLAAPRKAEAQLPAPPRPVPNAPVLQSTPEAAPNISTMKAGVPVRSTKTPTPSAPKSRFGSASAAQSGKDNQQTTVSGSTQSSTGDCSPNVMGNGNTTNADCAPKSVQFSEKQVAVASRELQAHHGLQGQVAIIYEWSAVDGQNAAEKLQSILAAAGITATIGSGGMVMEYVGAPSYPGLSFAEVREDNEALCNAIEQALKQSGAVRTPIRRLKAVALSGPLMIYIRKV